MSPPNGDREPDRFERVEARAVSKIYGRHRALSNVSLALEPSRVTALVGPNGAGKSTLLSLFSTLSRPSSGTMHFGTLPPERAAEARGRIGLLSHQAMTYGDLSGLENLVFASRLHRLCDPEAEAVRLLELFGLFDAAHRPAKHYSRGMLQRLALGRAMIGAPSLMLLDEPFTGLDRSSVDIVVEEIHRLRSRGAMVLLISHDIDSTAALADDVVVLVRGTLRLHHSGSVDGRELRELYASALEARRNGNSARPS